MLKKIKKFKSRSSKTQSSKAQSVIIQFTLFFLIGLGLFIGVGSLFRMQTDIFRGDVAGASLKLSSSYLTSAAILSVGCIECDVVESKLFISNATAGYFTEVSLSSDGIRTATSPASKEFASSMHNLNYTFQLEGQALSVQTINLTYERNQIKLEVSGV